MKISGKQFKKALQIADLTQEKAAEIIGVSRQTVNTWVKSAELSNSIIDKIKSTLQIDLTYEVGNLLSQQSNISANDNNKLLGNKLAEKQSQFRLNSPSGINQEATFYKALPKSPPKLEAVPVNLHPHQDDDDTGSAKFVYAPDGTMGMRVPIVPVKAQAGYLLGFADPEFYEDFETEIIPVDQQHKGIYIGFEVKGDSMMTSDPELMINNIYPGWRAIGKDLPKQKWAYKLHIHSYDYWIIVHKTEGILIKEIIKHDVENGVITIHSLNPAYEDKELRLDDIEQIFNVVQIVPKKRR